MSYRVQIKPGHPTGLRRRSGQTFTAVPVEVESVTDAMRADSWLQIVEIPAPQLTDAERAAKDASARRDAEEKAKAEAEEKAWQEAAQTAGGAGAAPNGTESSHQSDGNEGGSRRRRNN